MTESLAPQGRMASFRASNQRAGAAQEAAASFARAETLPGEAPSAETLARPRPGPRAPGPDGMRAAAPRPAGALDDHRRKQSDASKETALTMTIQWTPEAIRTLGATTDLPTLGEIFGLSTWRSREMAKTGEWEQAGIRVLKIGSRYRVIVQSILDVLGIPGDDAIPGDDTGGGQGNAMALAAQADGTAVSPSVSEAALPVHELPAGNGPRRPATVCPPGPAGAPQPEP